MAVTVYIMMVVHALSVCVLVYDLYTKCNVTIPETLSK